MEDSDDSDMVKIHAYSHNQVDVMHVVNQDIKSEIAEIKKNVNNGL